MQLMRSRDFKSANWRKTLRQNERRTYWVIAIFILLYVALGLFLDVVFYEMKLYAFAAMQNLGAHYYGHINHWAVLRAFLTFHLVPRITFITTGIAAACIFVTFLFHDRLMLLGTRATEVTAENADALGMEARQLYNVVEEMKIAAGLSYMPKVYLIDAHYMNAFASGYSEKSAMVAITKGLVAKLDRSELQAVMAHELTHIRHHDIKLTLFASLLTNLLLMLVDFLFYSVMFRNSGRRSGGAAAAGEASPFAMLIVVVIVLRYVLPVVTSFLMLFLSRTREYMADAGAVELMRDNEPLARALIKITDDHQVNQTQYQFSYGETAHEDVRRAAYIFDPIREGCDPVKSFSSLFSTHPNLQERLTAINYQREREAS